MPSIRLATPADAHAIAELSRDAIECGLGWTYTPARVLTALRSRITNVAVIRDDDTLHAAGIMDYGDTSAHLILLGVQRGERRRGLGRHVLTWLEECAATAGLRTIGVEVRADNPGAIAFYLAQGYRFRDRVPNYYRGVLDAMRFAKRLGV
ncbi:GNAT family N-acetyltransferase [Lysobacter tyrosinilyticus]